MGEQEHQEQVDDRFPWVRRKIRKSLLQLFGRGAAELVAQCQNRIFHRPSRHHGIVAEDDEPGKYPETPHPFPRSVGSQTMVSSSGVGLCMPSDNKLTEHQRQSKQEDAPQIDENEGGTAVLSRLNGETPYIPESYGRTSRGENRSKLAAEIFSCCQLYIF